MLEAVNSVLQTAPLVKASAEQVSTVDSFAGNPDRVQRAPQVPYLSPYFAIDSDAHVVLQIRDPQTGKVLESYPSSREMKARSTSQHSATDGVHHAAPAPTHQAHQKASTSSPAPTHQQIAAFVAAAHSGAGAQTGGHVTVLA